jgi:hypothetical protein
MELISFPHGWWILHRRANRQQASIEQALSVRFESGRILVFLWGRFWVLEPDDGKPSSPVLRGLGASNGARPLDS